MATIYPNRKNGKIISVKLKAYLGRDEQGKQIFRCKNWIGYLWDGLSFCGTDIPWGDIYP